jgi:hypothetical protein
MRAIVKASIVFPTYDVEMTILLLERPQFVNSTEDPGVCILLRFDYFGFERHATIVLIHFLPRTSSDRILLLSSASISFMLFIPIELYGG